MLESKSGTDSPPSPTFASVVCETVHNSVKTVMQEEMVKNDVIIANVQENNDDVTMVTSLCDKIGFSTKPTNVKRIGKKTNDRHRLLKVSFNSNFDARACCAQYHSATRNDENIPVMQLRLGKTKTEQDAFKRNNNLMYKINQKANEKNAGHAGFASFTFV
ncbi:hypothetical protein CAPTEDRAFT_204257 [Capitella teleta]|uniref:Uncharacterized protein n=1 Tax=Capitella teleta TaxID=283909 RepID=R7TXG9_CAPTE|nr:hypothetical protein CAPTEDRAFT_204257 [Capitella teleta]|eukprot:ELT98282.1 hypothetical protein CAPTEDRAFT_204257 [Capitella teleta]